MHVYVHVYAYRTYNTYIMSVLNSSATIFWWLGILVLSIWPKSVNFNSVSLWKRKLILMQVSVHDAVLMLKRNVCRNLAMDAGHSMFWCGFGVSLLLFNNVLGSDWVWSTGSSKNRCGVSEALRSLSPRPAASLPVECTRHGSGMLSVE